MPNNTIIALSGKGGVGKTTVAALLIRALKAKENGPVFAVDGDPNSCLGDYLGLVVEETVGGIREDTRRNITDIPAGMTKERWINYRMQDCLVESKGLDLIEMGRQEGPSCYCYVNNLLRDYSDKMYRNYRYTVIDNEAGMEHLSRRTTRKIDLLLIVSDLTNVGLKAASRISDLSGDLDLTISRKGIIVNRANSDVFEERSPLIEKMGLDVLGRIPVDPNLDDTLFSGGSLFDIPDDSPSLLAVKDIAESLSL